MLKVAKIVFQLLTEWGKRKIPTSPPILSAIPGNILPYEHCSCWEYYFPGNSLPKEYFTLGILYRLRTLYILPWEHCSWAWLFGCYKTTLLSLYNCVSHFTFIIHFYFYFYYFPFFHFFFSHSIFLFKKGAKGEESRGPIVPLWTSFIMAIEFNILLFSC